MYIHHYSPPLRGIVVYYSFYIKIYGHNPFESTDGITKRIPVSTMVYEQFPQILSTAAISGTEKKITNSLCNKMWNHLPQQRPEMQEKQVI